MAYRDVVLADVPAVFHEMQETSGTSVADSSGNSRTGTYVNGVTVNDSTDAACPSPLGKHIRLDGVSSTGGHVLLNNSTTWFTPATSGFTVEFWVYVRTYADYQRFFDFSNAVNNDDIYWIPRNNTSLQQVKVNGSSLTFATTALNLWHHCVLTVTSGGVAKAYVDGSQIASGTVGSPPNQARQYKYFGRSAWSSDPYLPASLSNVAVYNSVLPADRILTHYLVGGTKVLGLASIGVTVSVSVTLTAAYIPPGRLTPQPVNVAVNTLSVSLKSISYYQSVVLADSPAVFHPMQEASGTTAIETVGGLSGSYVNGVVVNDSTDPACPTPLRRHIRLDGAASNGGYVSLDATNWLAPATAGFTFECWIYVRSWVSSIRIFSFTNALSVNDMSLSTYPNNFTLDLSIGGTDKQFSVFTSVAWHHLVVTVTSAGAATIYIDNSVWASGSVGTLVDGPRQYKFLGRSAYSGDPFIAASLTHMAIYNSVLTPSKVSAHYTAGTVAITFLPLGAINATVSTSVTLSKLPKTLALQPINVGVNITVTFVISVSFTMTWSAVAPTVVIAKAGIVLAVPSITGVWWSVVLPTLPSVVAAPTATWSAVAPAVSVGFPAQQPPAATATWSAVAPVTLIGAMMVIPPTVRFTWSMPGAVPLMPVTHGWGFGWN